LSRMDLTNPVQFSERMTHNLLSKELKNN
ncbi:MAG: hypothetical protein ACI935_001108, partial [Moritella dasanensis]